MFRRPAARLSAQALRTFTWIPAFKRIFRIQQRCLRTRNFRRHVSIPIRYFTFPGPREFSSTPSWLGLMPETENPPPKESQPNEHITAATDISHEEYHQRADEFLDELHERLEAIQDKNTDIEVDYSSGVMTIEIRNRGSWVLNKQPPNKQVWLSSPISGPKRYDWVVLGESMHQKEGAGVGEWIYLRDGSSLTSLLRKELGVDMGIDDETAL